MFEHDLRFTHRRRPLVSEIGKSDAASELHISAGSEDLMEACGELLSRLPSDLYAALKRAMGRYSDD